MAARSTEMNAGGVQVLDAVGVAAALAPAWGPALLSELTHLPTGIAPAGGPAIELAPGASSGPHHHGPAESLVLVLAGRALIRWGTGLKHSTVAGPGDFVLIPAGTPHEECNPEPGVTLRYRHLGDPIPHLPLN